MRSITAVGVLLLAGGQATNDFAIVEEDLLINRALKAWNYANAGLENTTLGKPGNSVPGLACIVPQPMLVQATLPQRVRDAEYAVRGEIVKLSAEIQKEMDA